MERMRPVLLAATVFLFASTSANAAAIFTATINSAQEVPTNTSAATGLADFLLDDTMTVLTYESVIFGLDFTGMQTPDPADNLIAAHIHAPAPPGVNASVVFGFFGTPFNETSPNDVVVIPFATGVGGTIRGRWNQPEGNGTTLTAQLSNLLAGNSYINFHTTRFPGGEIRGQIALIPEPSTLSLLGIGVAGLVSRHYRRRMRRG